MTTFYSNGKLLLTAEYVVLDGAEALAVPTKYGQSLTVNQENQDLISWRSLDEKGQVWFETELPLDLKLETNNPFEVRLLQILKAAKTLNPHFLEQGATIETKLDFPRNWGLGTSSTLINNVAQWAQIDPFKLLQLTFGGSGYDIACAQTNAPITYQLQEQIPVFKTVDFQPDFADKLFFVFLNQKQDSREGIKRYQENKTQTQTAVSEISKLTQEVISCNHLEPFCNLLDRHEVLISKLIQKTPIKQERFPDFEGSIKSLGAWGGDFILVASQNNPTAYFNQKGLDVVIPFKDLIL